MMDTLRFMYRMSGILVGLADMRARRSTVFLHRNTQCLGQSQADKTGLLLPCSFSGSTCQAHARSERSGRRDGQRVVARHGIKYTQARLEYP